LKISFKKLLSIFWPITVKFCSKVSKKYKYFWKIKRVIKNANVMLILDLLGNLKKNAFEKSSKQNSQLKVNFLRLLIEVFFCVKLFVGNYFLVFFQRFCTQHKILRFFYTHSDFCQNIFLGSTFWKLWSYIWQIWIKILKIASFISRSQNFISNLFQY